MRWLITAGICYLYGCAALLGCDADDIKPGATNGSTSSGTGGTGAAAGSGGSHSGGSGAAAGSGGADGGGGGSPACLFFESQQEEYAPIQTAGSGLPAGAELLTWSRPASYVYLGAFSGTAGSPAGHEGVDYVHDSASVATVDVGAAADGQVVYVRLGCPQSTEFGFNTALRECGAGWGNHVVVHHGSGIMTRYAHLKPDATVVVAGETVSRGQKLSLMGSSGRSDVRHLHFELGTAGAPLDPCAPAQSFDHVYDSGLLAFQ